MQRKDLELGNGCHSAIENLYVLSIGSQDLPPKEGEKGVQLWTDVNHHDYGDSEV